MKAWDSLKYLTESFELKWNKRVSELCRLKSPPNHSIWIPLEIFLGLRSTPLSNEFQYRVKSLHKQWKDNSLRTVPASGSKVRVEDCGPKGLQERRASVWKTQHSNYDSHYLRMTAARDNKVNCLAVFSSQKRGKEISSHGREVCHVERNNQLK